MFLSYGRKVYPFKGDESLAVYRFAEVFRGIIALEADDGSLVGRRYWRYWYYRNGL